MESHNEISKTLNTGLYSNIKAYIANDFNTSEKDLNHHLASVAPMMVTKKTREKEAKRMKNKNI